MHGVGEVVSLVAQSLEHEHRSRALAKIDAFARLRQKMRDVRMPAARFYGGNDRELSITRQHFDAAFS